MSALRRWVVLLALAGCGDDEPPPETCRAAAPSGPAAWQVALDGADLGRAALSVWGAARDRLFVVGGALGNGAPALALAYEGGCWRDLAPGGERSFWWVAGTSASDVWMVGEGGRITHFDGSRMVEHDSGTTATLFGVWAFAADDVWAVGGTPEGGSAKPNDVVLRYDGKIWRSEDLPGDPRGLAHYKVWGPKEGELYVVGEGGAIWHLEGGVWADESGAATGTLFTVWGCSATEIYAVGGFDVLTSKGDGTWSAVTVELTNAMNGISCAGDEVVIVGNGGAKQRRVGGAWIDDFIADPHQDLHAAWTPGGGEAWAVGGDFVTGPKPGATRVGVVARYGQGSVADRIE
jgi:hypothetical protein